MQIKAIIVDVGGVLVQSLDTSKRREWEVTLHLLPGQLTSIVFSEELGRSATVGAITSEDIWRDIQDKFVLSDEAIMQLRTDFYVGSKVNVPFFTYIQSLKGKYKTIILSDAWDDARAVYTQKFHLDTIVDRMFISAEEGISKSDPQFLQIALDYLGTNCEETIYIDDTVMCIRLAKDRGLQTILFTDTKTAIGKMEALLGE